MPYKKHSDGLLPPPPWLGRCSTGTGRMGSLISASSLNGKRPFHFLRMLYIITHDTITCSTAWSFRLSFIMRQGNILFKIPKAFSILTREWQCALLKTISGLVLQCYNGVMKYCRSGYPLSTNNIPSISWLSNRGQMLLFSKILLSWVLPGHLATMFVKLHSWSHIALTLIEKNPFLFL